MLDEILAIRNFDIPYLDFGGIRLKVKEVFLVKKKKRGGNNFTSRGKNIQSFVDMFYTVNVYSWYPHL